MYIPTTEQELAIRVRELAPLVRRMAHHMMAALPPSVEIDEVIQSGMTGLLDAAQRFRASEDAQFETYAAQHIRGAMLDALRQRDRRTPGVRRSLRAVEKVISRLEHQNGRAPTEAELAEALDRPVAECRRLLQDARGYQIVSYEFNADDHSFIEGYAIDHDAGSRQVLQDRGSRAALN